MATMRVRRSRVDRRAIGLWLAGVLCGVLLMTGINGLHGPSHPAAPAAVVAPAAANQVLGMRDEQAAEPIVTRAVGVPVGGGAGTSVTPLFATWPDRPGDPDAAP